MLFLKHFVISIAILVLAFGVYIFGYLAFVPYENW